MWRRLHPAVGLACDRAPVPGRLVDPLRQTMQDLRQLNPIGPFRRLIQKMAQRLDDVAGISLAEPRHGPRPSRDVKELPFR